MRQSVLRRYPSVPVNSRAALRTTTLPTGGSPDGTDPILIRNGEAVGYCVYPMHRRKDISGPNTEAFRPERWEDPALVSRVGGWRYLLFYGGPRACLGQGFALLEAGYTIVRMLQVCGSLEMVGGGSGLLLAGETGAYSSCVLWRWMLRTNEEILTDHFK